MAKQGLRSRSTIERCTIILCNFSIATILVVFLNGLHDQKSGLEEADVTNFLQTYLQFDLTGLAKQNVSGPWPQLPREDAASRRRSQGASTLTDSAVRVSTTRILSTSIQTQFVHQGLCNRNGWTGTNLGSQSSLQECAEFCANQGDNVGYLAYRASPSKCVCYYTANGCPDDDSHNHYNAYRILRNLCAWAPLGQKKPTVDWTPCSNVTLCNQYHVQSTHGNSAGWTSKAKARKNCDRWDDCVGYWEQTNGYWWAMDAGAMESQNLLTTSISNGAYQKNCGASYPSSSFLPANLSNSQSSTPISSSSVSQAIFTGLAAADEGPDVASDIDIKSSAGHGSNAWHSESRRRAVHHHHDVMVALEDERHSTRASGCRSSFYAFGYEEFEKVFPSLAKCGFSALASVADKVLRIDKQPCRADSPEHADLLFPPPYLLESSNWPFYCNGFHSVGNVGLRDQSTGRIRIASQYLHEQCEQGHCNLAANDDVNQDIGCQELKQKAYNCRSGNLVNMLMDRNAWLNDFNVSLHLSKLVIFDFDNSWESQLYSLPDLVYTAPHVIWAKVGARIPNNDTTPKHVGWHRDGFDISLPPPPFSIAQKLMKISTRIPGGKKKSYFMTFVGMFKRSPNRLRRKIHEKFHNGRDILIINTLNNTKSPSDRYVDLMTNTVFALILRGDNLWSFRVNEAICAGAIPVLVTDFWAPPFDDSLPWTTFGVVVNETRWPDLVSILQNITESERKRLRYAARSVCFDVFQASSSQIQHAVDVLSTKRNFTGKGKRRY